MTAAPLPSRGAFTSRFAFQHSHARPRGDLAACVQDSRHPCSSVTTPPWARCADLWTGRPRSPPPVLLMGETGTGKSLVARVIHERSPRARAPFMAINCAAVPEALFESELFGHRQGAFTGAHENRAGLIKSSHGGTLLLDEVGDLPLAQQAKLLTVLEQGEVRPVGASTTVKVDVRVVSATARELETRARAGELSAGPVPPTGSVGGPAAAAAGASRRPSAAGDPSPACGGGTASVAEPAPRRRYREPARRTRLARKRARAGARAGGGSHHRK